MAVDHDPISELRESLRRRAPVWEPERPARPVPDEPTFKQPPERAATSSSSLPHPRPVVPPSAVARTTRARVRWPQPRVHVDIPWRRGGVALRQLLRATRSVMRALASALAVRFRSAARATRRATRLAARATRRATRLAARVTWRTVRFAARVAQHAIRLAARGAGRAWRAAVPLVRAAGRALWAALMRSAKAAARERARRRERAAIRAAARQAAVPPQPVTEIAPVEPPLAPAIALDASERHLEELERRQLEQRIEALGPDHPDVAVILQLVAERCAARGATDEALTLYCQALRIQEITFGPDSAALGPLLHDLADLERELGHDADAMHHEARREMLAPHAAPRTERSRPNGGRVVHTSSVLPSNGSAATPSNGGMRAH